MRLIAHLVTRNEAGRYLEQCLRWLRTFVDDIVVFDDFSSDDTVTICERNGAHVTVRDPELSSFLEHEGMFRSAGWATIGEHAAEGDWVFAVDADEFLVGPSWADQRHVLNETIAVCEAEQATGVNIAVREVWAFDENDRLLIRTDGFWGNLWSLRLAKWTGDCQFPDRPLGCGSVPETVVSAVRDVGVDLLHYGYTAVDDRRARFDRYNGRTEHNPVHVRSILEHPTLKVWDGKVPT